MSTETTSVTGQDFLLGHVRDGSWLDDQKFAPLTYPVQGLIPEGFTLLVGPPKAGKSWLVLGLLLAVAADDGRALGTICAGAGQPVLYLALEDGDRRMQDRCRALLGDGNRIPALFFYLTRVTPGTVVATIEAFLKLRPDTALVVIDTLGKVMPPSVPGESAYQRDYRVGGSLKRIADDHPGLAVVVLHHDRKAIADDFVDSVSGTHGLAGAADTVVVLARARQSSEGVLRVTGRDVEEGEYALTMLDGAWALDGANLAQAANKAATQREVAGLSDRSGDVLRFVLDHPEGVTPAATSAAVEIDNKTAGTYLGRLADGGRIVRQGRGRYAPPRSAVESVGSVESEDPDDFGFNTFHTPNTHTEGIAA